MYVTLSIVFIHSQILEAADKIQAIDMKKRSLKIIVSNFHKVSGYSSVIVFIVLQVADNHAKERCCGVMKSL